MARFDGGFLAYDRRNGVFTFSGADGGRDLLCSMSDEVLAEICHQRVPPADAVFMFREHEQAVFELALRKYTRYGTGRDGRVLLTKFDVLGSVNH
jgi:Protein of unknown function (DUF1488)